MAIKRWQMADVAKTNAKVATPVRLTKKARKVVNPADKVDKKPSKYKNERVQVAGKVTWFTWKVTYWLPGGIRYIADFVVVRDDPLVMGSVVQVIDVKGMETDVFKLKRKLMREQGVEILLQ